MLNENAIEKLIQPLIYRQEKINLYVIKKIAERVKEIGTLLPSDVYKIERLLKSGNDVKEISAELSRLTALQVRDINNIIISVAKDAYTDLEPFFLYRELDFIPFAKNEQLQKVVESISRQTIETYENLSKAQAFMIRDLKNPKKLIPTSISKTYYSVIDEAVQASQSGVTDYNTAIRRTMKQLVNSGIRNVTYHPESGRTYTQRLDTAVRRNILGGIRAINQGVQDVTGEQFGADGKEITVHENSALDHEPIQGHQFTSDEFDKLQNGERFRDVSGKVFEPIDRAIGTLNCRHFTFSIIVGVTKPIYTEDQLKAFIKRNHEGYTLPNGKHLTMYECTQVQRDYELKIRQAKEGREVAKTSGDLKLEEEYSAKIHKLIEQYKSFSNACGLKPKFTKTNIQKS